MNNLPLYQRGKLKIDVCKEFNRGYVLTIGGKCEYYLNDLEKFEGLNDSALAMAIYNSHQSMWSSLRFRSIPISEINTALTEAYQEEQRRKSHQ